MAASRRAASLVTWAASMAVRATAAGGSWVRNTGPMPMPAQTAMPGKALSDLQVDVLKARSRRLCWGGGGSVLFIEAGLDEPGQRIEGFFRVPAFGSELDLGALSSSQHHQSHD